MAGRPAMTREGAAEVAAMPAAPADAEGAPGLFAAKFDADLAFIFDVAHAPSAAQAKLAQFGYTGCM
eukprot:7262732-Lingulodinium_polyedra.AAC.1